MLLRFGEPWHERRLNELQNLPIAKIANSGGYDGQFYAQIATTPLLQSPDLERAIDAPAYRSRRILMPWVAALLGLGNAWWTLQVFALLNVVAWCVLARILWREIAETNANGFARWSGCVLSLGVMESVRQSLVDLPALALTAWAIAAWRAGHLGRSKCAGALAVLTKETAWLAVLAVPRWRPGDNGKELRGAVALAAVAALPLAIWMVFVAQRFGRWSETALAGNFDWPGVALACQILEWVQALSRGEWSDRALFGVLGIAGFAVQSVVLWFHAARDNPWWRVGVAHTLLLLVLGGWVWGGYWAAARALLPLTIAFNLLLPSGRGFWVLWACGNFTLVHGLIRFV